ncbi:hypothetical protein [Phytomonospora endophytica]|uniref:Uncharacterized protein n=1 Tax=Phytomonospora endophytica TaxID=714109 RepID=A0A841FRG2_9ACTN|nr:hypothetical protein [Phytomonospora endophytica]MBB6036368.1 hypothetical protein [Phytomonospora endophytica]GIG67274.1 hypothetical protein Pen01_35690 [Phytomonospora endophytica]
MDAYEEFVAFVHNRIFDLRREAHQVTGDDRLADILLVRALAKVAGAWPREHDAEFDPEQLAYDHLTRDAGVVLREADSGGDGGIHIDGAEYEEGPHRLGTALAVADAAWEHSQKMRRRRWRGVVVGVIIAALLLAGYYVASRGGQGGDPEPETVDDPNRVTLLLDGVDLLPNEATVPQAPLWSGPETGLPKEITTDPDDLPTVSENPPGRITAALQAGAAGPVILLDEEGRAHRLDTVTLLAYSNEYLEGSVARRSVSPSGKFVALAQPNTVVVAGLTADEPRRFTVPINSGGAGDSIVDIAWYVDDTAILLTQAGATSLLDLATGTWTQQQFHGVDAVTPTTWAEPAHVITPGPLGEPSGAFLKSVSYTIPTPTSVGEWKAETIVAPGATWLGQFTSTGEQNEEGLVARTCLPKDAVFKMPDGYGPAVDCVAIIDPASGTLERALIRDSSHQAGPRFGFVKWLDAATLLLAVQDVSGGRTLIVAWSYFTGELHVVSAVDGVAMVGG